MLALMPLMRPIEYTMFRRALIEEVRGPAQSRLANSNAA
jgi:hypothetical protein